MSNYCPIQALPWLIISAELLRPLGLVIRLELAVLPVGLECRDEAVPQMGRLVLAQLDGPLQPLCQGRVRQVGGADIGRAEVSIAVKQVRLGV